ncbi:MAG: hypothetical protein MRY78_01315 [Saprospiraceae bacterium]|nr:hypothetical protein [Saprospiraceae bacterium]
MKINDIPNHVAVRILDFFNRVKYVTDITDTLIEDDPSDGPGNTIGATLAARILRVRSKFPFNRFETLEQLDAIQGFGEGTWKDLVYTFGRTAAQAFRDGLYVNNIIYRENWPVWCFEFPIEDKEQFEELEGNETAYRNFIAQKLAEIAEQEEVHEGLATQAIEGVKEAHIDRFEDATLSALTLGMWFYRVDPGNWFSIDRIYEETLEYFEYFYPKYPFQAYSYNNLLTMVAFNGVPGNIIMPTGITANDLITVINYPEQSITIWMAALYD